MLSRRFFFIPISYCSAVVCSFALVLCFAFCPLAVRATPPGGGTAAGEHLAGNSHMQRSNDSLLHVYTHRANQVLDHYVKAQKALYAQDHEKAMTHIDQALLLTENADLLAFKGAVYFGMGKLTEARASFSQAFAIDRKAAVPFVEGLQEWLRQNRLPR